MEELIAKRYLKAIKQNSTTESINIMASVFSVLAKSFKDERFNQIINNPDVSKNQKLEILLSEVKSAASKDIEKLIEKYRG